MSSTSSIDQRVDLQPAYVLHSKPFRNTSRIVSVFSRDYGRVDIIAKGVRGAKSPLRAVLQTFTPLSISWRGRTDLKIVTGVEPLPAATPELKGDALFSAYYLSELLMTFTAIGDPHSDLFSSYGTCLIELALSDRPHMSLRLFEKRLLDSLGFALNLTELGTGEAVVPEQRYGYDVRRGPTTEKSALQCDGSSLLALANEELTEAQAISIAPILRAEIDRLLDGRILKSREVLLSMRQHQ